MSNYQICYMTDFNCKKVGDQKLKLPKEKKDLEVGIKK